MNFEVARQTQDVLASELAALNTGRSLLIERFPRGPEADISQYREWLRTELTYTSNAIEGSTLSSVETRMVVE